ncbi:type 1 glutamine amidotransferase domain-containing protein [Psychrobacter pygoscelis]|uniref:type 1 glutamine amidotransferase domain-containing protein n=1 Tax=Psychrobacter pygoscelis TaxID=2488563 RepID=UPI00103A0C4D|nr:type 1 glutamine amidotransferase domain-containing protein [Psychrobacter pygoscelis]
MKKIAFLLHTDFEQAEYEDVNNQLKDKGYATTLITTNDEQQVQGMNHSDKADTFTADLFAKDADADDYDAVVLPGGTINADALRGNEAAQKLIKAFNDAGKPIAAICHAPWAFINIGIAKGKTLTAYQSLKTDLENAGATFVDKALQKDGNLITSRTPEDIPDFVNAIDEALS